METDQEKRQRIKDILEQQRFNYNDPPEEKEGLVSIIDNGEEIPVLYRQGILVVYGKPKSRKSTFLTIIGASAYKGKPVGKIKTTIKGKILWFDTEQTGTEFYNLQKKLYDMCGITETDRIISYPLVAFGSMEDRLEAIKITLEEHGDETDLIVIDGIKDLLLDSGEEATSKQLIEELRALEVRYDCGLITVIHTSKTGEDLVGRLGTLLSEKLSYGFKIAQDRTSKESLIEPGYSRGKEFESFRVWHGEDGTVEFREDFNPIPVPDQTKEEIENDDAIIEAGRNRNDDEDDLPF